MMPGWKDYGLTDIYGLHFRRWTDPSGRTCYTRPDWRPETVDWTVQRYRIDGGAYAYSFDPVVYEAARWVEPDWKKLLSGEIGQYGGIRFIESVYRKRENKRLRSYVRQAQRNRKPWRG